MSLDYLGGSRHEPLKIRRGRWGRRPERCGRSGNQIESIREAHFTVAGLNGGGRMENIKRK